MGSAPSYITKRNDTYYFQVHAPNGLQSKVRLIRRSLRTKSRRKALALARIWWVELANNNFQWEDEAREQDQVLARGKGVYQRLLNHDQQTRYHNGESDPLAVDDFFGSLTSIEQSDLEAYTSYVNQPPLYQSDIIPDICEPAGKAKSGHRDAEINTLLSAIQDSQTQNKLAVRGIEETGKPLSQLLDSYIREKARKSNPVKLKMDKGLFDIETEIQRLIMFVGDVSNDKLTKKVLKERYIDQRAELPNSLHRKAEYATGKQTKKDRLTGKTVTGKNGKPLTTPVYKPVDEIIEVARNKDGVTFHTARTINNEFGTIATFLRAMEREGLTEKGLGSYLVSCMLEQDEDSSVISFTSDDLKQLFNNETYCEGLLFDKPHRHWLPLISLYHGNRIGEMAMLFVDDLRPFSVEVNGQLQNIWGFLIQRNDERKQGRKNKQSARIVPVHQSLIDLGLIEYRQQLIDSGEQQLFPAEEPNSGDNWGNNTSAWFNNSHDGNTNHGKGYVEWCGVQKHVTIDGVKKKKVFHSLRKNWITQAKRLELDPDMRREITGHGEGRSLDVHARTYEDNYELWAQKQALDRVQFDLDLSAIRRWKSNKT